MHLNPVSAKMVKDPLHYKWSSHGYYVRGDAPTWLDTQTIQEVINRKTQLEYLDFMSRPVEREKWKPALYYFNNVSIVIDDTLMKNANCFKSLSDVANQLNPILRRWINYYGKYHKTALCPVFRHVNLSVIRWMMRKFKRFKGHKTRAGIFLEGVLEKEPGLFARWRSRVSREIHARF